MGAEFKLLNVCYVNGITDTGLEPPMDHNVPDTGLEDDNIEPESVAEEQAVDAVELDSVTSGGECCFCSFQTSLQDELRTHLRDMHGVDVKATSATQPATQLTPQVRRVIFYGLSPCEVSMSSMALILLSR